MVFVKTALQAREISKAIVDEDVSESGLEQTVKIIIDLLRDSPVRAVQYCESEKVVWNKLKSRYVGQTMINKVRIFNKQLNTKLRAGGSTGDYISLMESQMSRLT